MQTNRQIPPELLEMFTVNVGAFIFANLPEPLNELFGIFARIERDGIEIQELCIAVVLYSQLGGSWRVRECPAVDARGKIEDFIANLKVFIPSSITGPLRQLYGYYFAMLHRRISVDDFLDAVDLYADLGGILCPIQIVDA